jgi:hypothetical protein
MAIKQDAQRPVTSQHAYDFYSRDNNPWRAAYYWMDLPQSSVPVTHARPVMAGAKKRDMIGSSPYVQPAQMADAGIGSRSPLLLELYRYQPR